MNEEFKDILALFKNHNATMLNRSSDGHQTLRNEQWFLIIGAAFLFAGLVIAIVGHVAGKGSINNQVIRLVALTQLIAILLGIIALFQASIPSLKDLFQPTKALIKSLRRAVPREEKLIGCIYNKRFLYLDEIILFLEHRLIIYAAQISILENLVGLFISGATAAIVGYYLSGQQEEILLVFSGFVIAISLSIISNLWANSRLVELVYCLKAAKKMQSSDVADISEERAE